MPFSFSLACDLLEESFKQALAHKKSDDTVAAWFARNRHEVDAHDTSLPALLSTLLPEKRTDRVYRIRAPTLEKIIGRALGLGSSRLLELAAYRQPGSGLDLADCVERLLTVTVSTTVISSLAKLC